jgi:hypothetical protein
MVNDIKNQSLQFYDKDQVTTMTAVILGVLVASFPQLWHWTAEDSYALKTKITYEK